MLIDWFTVAAQALNFIILVWLLKRFLYRPILSALDAREKRIASELADAAKMKADVHEVRDDFQRKSDEFEQQRAALMGKASDEAKVERQRLLDDARNAADALSINRQAAMRGDAINLNQEIRRSTQREVFAIARRALTDLASTDLEVCMTDVFIQRLRTLDVVAEESLCSAIKTMVDPVIIRSTFELPKAQRSEIQKAVNETYGAEVRIMFDTAPDLVSGIELIADGQKLAWSIANYLVALESSMADLLKERESMKVTENKPEAQQV
tara:strand:- start:11777 stop:12580 length:804 start_codon:yes stop_codon:yes gene_type:complete